MYENSICLSGIALTTRHHVLSLKLLANNYAEQMVRVGDLQQTLQ